MGCGYCNTAFKPIDIIRVNCRYTMSAIYNLPVNLKIALAPEDFLAVSLRAHKSYGRRSMTAEIGLIAA